MLYRPAYCLIVVPALLCACARELPVVEVQGECTDVFGAQLCTWARMRGETVVEVGADVAVASIENAPKDAQMAWPPIPVAQLGLPAAVPAQAGLTHLTMYWEAMGHPPGAYLTPHFDFHFYTVPPEERSAIDCADVSKPSALPAAYSLPNVTLPSDFAKMLGVSTLIGLCVPQMGMHSLLTTELESSTTFRGTMVIGYYQGKPIFIEPMLTRAMLLEKQSFTLSVPSIPGMTGAYPRSFRADYDTQKQVYRFVFASMAAGS